MTFLLRKLFDYNRQLTIFISHSGSEAQLAAVLKAWFESQFTDVKCFCTSTPGDIAHGNDWRNQIEKNARKNNIILLLFNPETIANPWLHLEAGIALGASAKARVIPVVYGGLGFGDIPNTLKNRQGLDLQNSADFNSFIQATILNGRQPNDSQTLQDFLDANPGIKRLLKYGRIGGWVPGDIQSRTLGPMALTTENQRILIPMTDDRLRLISARARIRPRRSGVVAHWKCGFSFEREDQNHAWIRVFEVHGGLHNGIMTWSLYAEERQMICYNIPAHLEQDLSHELQIWLSPDRRGVTCIGFDDRSKRTILVDDRGSEEWRPDFDNIQRLVLKGWADTVPYHVDVESIDLDYVAI